MPEALFEQSSVSSARAWPSAAASSRAAVDLPAPMKPMKTIVPDPIRCPVGARPRSRRRCGRRRTSAVRVGEHERDHRLADDAGGGTVQESVRSRSAWAGSCVSVSTERSGLVSVGSGFIAPRTISGLPVRHAALEPAGAVGLAEVAALGGVEDLVVRLPSRAARDREAVADRDALDRLDRADRLGEASVEALLPGDVRAEPGERARRPAPRRRRRATRWPCAVRRSRRPSPASHRRRGSEPASCRRRRSRPRVSARPALGRCTEAICITCESTSTPSARRNALQSAPPATRAAVSRAEARSRMLRTSLTACTSGCRRGRRVRVAADAPRPSPRRPATGSCGLPSWRSRGCAPAARSGRRASPVAHAGGHLGGVALDLHAPAAAVAELAAGHVVVDVLLGARRSPAGIPSTRHVRPGPCDSPAVISRSSTAPSLFCGSAARSRVSCDRGARRRGPAWARTRARPAAWSSAGTAAPAGRPRAAAPPGLGLAAAGAPRLRRSRLARP